jgi:uncharacterized repeat protein (TIGR03843 family)
MAVSPEEAALLLEKGEIRQYEAVSSGSNYTFLVMMSAAGRGKFLAVYKPQRGERPLWDFPRGTLHRRERAAYITSRTLGWPNIPVTVIRDGPFGIGSVQLFVPTASRPDLFAFQEERRKELMEIALFDLLVNNADRKAGHCLLGVDGRVWAIDHGLTFHVDPKLRTVLWDYCGEPIPQRLLEDLESLREDPARRDVLRAELETELAPEEINAFFRRADRLLRFRRYPRLDPTRNIPWPLV